MAGQNQFIRRCSLIVYGSPPPPLPTGAPAPAAPALVPATPAAAPAPGSVPPVVSTPPQAAPQGGPGTDNSLQRGIELASLRVQFRVYAADVDAPPTASIRVFNLSAATARRVKSEFSSVVLQAGYENGNFGIIFQGTIVRVRSGRLDNKDTFVEIMASNLDLAYNFGMAVGTMAAGGNGTAVANKIRDTVNQSAAMKSAEAAGQSGYQYGSVPSSLGTGGVLPRGKVLFGLADRYLNQLTATRGMTWSIGVDGRVNIIESGGYLPGEAVVLNARTGLINVPEATQQGVEAECLLNPSIKTGGRIQINNADINITVNRSAVGFPAYADFQFFADTSADGIYRAIVVEHTGDTRGHGDDWKTIITALALDQTAPPAAGGKVLAAGA